MFRGGFTAEQDRRDGEDGLVQFLFDPTFRHQGQKFALVSFPTSFSLFVIVEQLLGWGEHWLVYILRAADFTEEIREVGAFGESGKLGDVVKANIEQAANPGVPQKAEELFCFFFVKPME